MPKRQGLTTQEFAEFYSVDRRTVDGWEKKGWLVRYDGDRSIDADASAAIVDANRDRKRSHRETEPKLSEVRTPTLPPDGHEAEYPVPKDVTLDDARTRKEHWLAVRAEHEAKKAAGELVDRETIRKEFVAVGHAFKAAAQSLPPSLVGPVMALTHADPSVAVELEALLMRLVNQALQTLADKASNVGDVTA